ncbi:MAG: pilus assembly protein PilM [Candidatus Omnitrophica bacterium]|nr:pilus assembly protein PilM [Candidatus Omnitrophota bacterium]
MITLPKLSLPSAKIFTSRRSNDFLAVDISPNHVRIIHATQDAEDAVLILHAASRQFGDQDEAQISEFLTQFAAENGIGTRDVICIVPSTMFISKNVDMPSNDLEEISKIVDLQAGRYTPYSRDEIVIDYLCMESPGQHYTNVLLTIVNRRVIDRFYQIIEKAGMDILKIVIASEAMASCYDRIADARAEEAAVGGLHIAENYTDFTVMDQHQLVFVRSIPLGSAQLKANAAQTQADFISELEKSTLAYHDQGIGRAIQTFVVSGAPETKPMIQKLIQSAPSLGKVKNLSVQFVEAAALVASDSQAFSHKEGLTEDNFFDMTASLAALPLLKLDLTPKEYKLKRRFREGGREVITLGVLLMACIVLLCIFLASKIYIKNEITGKIDSIDQETAEEALTLEKASTKARVVRNLIKNRGKALYVFERVTSLIGDDIYLTDFKYDQEGALLLTGTANSMSRVFAFVTDLEESNYFSSVKTKSTKSRRVGQLDVADFEIECQLVEESEA